MLEQLGSDELLLDVKRPGSALVRVRWTPYWFAAGGCVERADVCVDQGDRPPARRRCDDG